MIITCGHRLDLVVVVIVVVGPREWTQDFTRQGFAPSLNHIPSPVRSLRTERSFEPQPCRFFI